MIVNVCRGPVGAGPPHRAARGRTSLFLAFINILNIRLPLQLAASGVESPSTRGEGTYPTREGDSDAGRGLHARVPSWPVLAGSPDDGGDHGRDLRIDPRLRPQ